MLSLSLIVKGQKEIVNFLQAPEISIQFATEYLTPLSKMMDNNIRSGWYKTAKAHRFLGFDVGLSLSIVNSPSNKRGYYINQIKDFNQYYRIKDGSYSVAANIAGETISHPIIKNKDNGREIELPKGEGLEKLSLPVIAAGIGLPYNTEIRIKLTPNFNVEEVGSVMQYGIGIKHSIKEYLPGLEDIPALSVSVFGAYSILSNKIDLDYPSSLNTSQSLEGITNGYSGRILAGVDVPYLSAFIGIGYGSSTIEYALKGDYYIGDLTNEQDEKDPLKVTYEYSKVEVDIGLKLKLGFVEFSAAYTPGEYSTFNVGAGLNIR